jgi:hypothetical protein
MCLGKSFLFSLSCSLCHARFSSPSLLYCASVQRTAHAARRQLLDISPLLTDGY